ncbi:MAG: AI-2E family transporter [Solirubrobacteraceae bacterium]
MTAPDDTELEEPAAPDGAEPVAAPTPVPPARVAPVVVPRWMQLVGLPLAVLGAYSLLRAAGGVLLLFVVAGLIALLLNPFVTLLRRLGLPRGVAVLAVFGVLLLLLAGIGALLANPIANQVSSIQDNVPTYVRDANRSLAGVQRFFDDKGINLQIADQGRTALQTLGDRLTKGSGSIVEFTRAALTKLVEASLAVILLLALSVYLLLYGERIGAGVRGLVPRGDGSPQDDFPTRIQQAVLGYVRGQLLFSLIMGTSAGVLLFMLGLLGIFPEGKTYALAFGAFYGFAELIPYIGPAIGGFPPVLLALFGAHPIDALWLVIAFVVLQQLEGHIVAPNVFAQALRINPILVIFALLMGAQLYGIVGALIALPIAAMLRETIVYFRRHLVLESWPRGGGGALPPVGLDPGGGSPCPECGAPVAADAPACAACGTEVPDAGARAAAASSAPG